MHTHTVPERTKGLRTNRGANRMPTIRKTKCDKPVSAADEDPKWKLIQVDPCARVCSGGRGASDGVAREASFLDAEGPSGKRGYALGNCILSKDYQFL